MCGIAGYYSLDAPLAGTGRLLEMLGTIAHRGPDDQGLLLVDAIAGKAMNCATPSSDLRIREVMPDAGSARNFSHQLAFAHCRYSIVDLTPGGHQPMWDKRGLVCVSFNGEIYNYVELRDELENRGRTFRTKSDTEVLLEGYLEWGTELFQRLNGQWALSLYESRTRKLLLARDRLGKVPLYYAVRDGRLYWASEIKAILAACGPNAFPVRSQAVDDYVVEGWRDRDGTFWEGIEDFPPASFAWANPDGGLEIHRFWELVSERMGTADISPEEAARRVGDILVEAIRIRVRADVPVAFELSGGMDSSSLVALAAQSLPDRLTSYTVEFSDPKYNEAPYAKAVVERFQGKVEYRALKPGHDDFWRDANQFIWMEEEPFHAPNLHTNQSLRRQMRADGSKVVISGAAGDEVLAGYAGEYFAPYLLYLLAKADVRRFMLEAKANTGYPPSFRNTVDLSMGLALPEFWKSLLRWRSGENGFLNKCYVAPSGVRQRPSGPRTFSARMRANMGHAKMNYWLRSANKSNFGIPIEPRAPFLDYRFVDFAFSLPPEYLIRDGWHKWILRKAMTGVLPEQVLWRRTKMGFPFPISDWLIASRQQIISNLENSNPYLNVAAIDDRYDVFARTNPFALWRLVSLGLWWRRVVEGRPLADATG